MNYIIKNQIDGSYLTYGPKKTPQCRWVETLEDASKWDNMKKAQNFMNHNYRALMRFVPAKDAKIIPCETVSYLQESCVDDTVTTTVCAEEEVVSTEESVEAEESVGVESDEIVDMEDAMRRLESLPNFDRVGREVRMLCKYFDGLMSENDGKVNDYLHKIELGERMSAADRAVLFKRLQETLRQRRTVKNIRKKLNLYYETSLLYSIDRFVRVNQALDERMANATYMPRVLTELFEDKRADEEPA